ncbi:MAG: ABC transporter ATP-binding protein/permease [Spirochaetaceae bacterium]|jgi:ATP-binding cassette subfamily B protein|nr:ABC transporter ATP-binding protein/permease [Spirochaetaceae bacterium]
MNNIKVLFPYLKIYRIRYLAGFLCLILVDAAQMLIPQYIKNAVNIITSGAFEFKQILYISLLMIGTMFIIASGRFLWRYFIHGSSRRIETALRGRLFSHLLCLSDDFYQRNKIGDLMARATNDAGAVRMAVGWGLVGLVDGTIMMAVILIIIFVQNGQTAALAVMPLPFITLLIVLFGKAIGPRFMKAQAAYSNMSDAVQESFAGSRVIKSFVKENFFVNNFAAANDEYKETNLNVVRLHGFFFPFVTFLSGLTMLIVTYAGGMRVMLGTMTAGGFVALFSYIQMLIWPVFGAGFTVNMIQRGLVSLKRINEILSTEPSVKSEVEFAPAGWKENTGLPVIEFRNVSFSYIPGKPALSNISFSLPAGKWLGILGRTGAGKSTLLKLITRLEDPPHNSVFVYGVCVHSIPLPALRGIFAVSPQDSYLFSDTIRNNILYGTDGSASDSGISSIISLAALDRDIAEFVEGDAALIGERGLTLSGGQKQRLSIARAAIMEAEVLMLDDSLSACDADTERRILTALAESRRGKTTVIVSHRISAFRNADYVAVLENGALTEFGAPQELLKTGGFYAQTARLQQLSV